MQHFADRSISDFRLLSSVQAQVKAAQANYDLGTFYGKLYYSDDSIIPVNKVHCRLK